LTVLAFESTAKRVISSSFFVVACIVFFCFIDYGYMINLPKCNHL